MNLARRSVGFACLAICMLCIGTTTLFNLSVLGILSCLIAVVTGIYAVICLRP